MQISCFCPLVSVAQDEQSRQNRYFFLPEGRFQPVMTFAALSYERCQSGCASYHSAAQLSEVPNRGRLARRNLQLLHFLANGAVLKYPSVCLGATIDLFGTER